MVPTMVRMAMLPMSSGHWFPSLRRYEPDQVQGSGRAPTLSPLRGPPRNDSNLCLTAILVNPWPDRGDSGEGFFRFEGKRVSGRISLTGWRGSETWFRRKTHQLRGRHPLATAPGGLGVDDARSAGGQSLAFSRHTMAMSTIIPFRRPAPPTPARTGCDVAAVAGDLLVVLEQLEGLVARAAHMDRPRIEVERSVQHLLDAISAVERASDTLGEGSSISEPA